MEGFETTPMRRPRPRRKTSFLNGGGRIANVLSLLVMVATLLLLVVYLNIFLNPYSFLNPFPPGPRPSETPGATPTNTLPPTLTPSRTALIDFPPTWTPTPTSPPSDTPTPRPTSTPFITDTAQPTTTLEPTPQGGFAFELQQGSPQHLPNIFHTDAGCNWLGVAGQALRPNNSGVVGLLVQVGGTLNGQLMETKLSMTGTASQYGPGGFEFVLADRPFASQGKLWIQLLDQSNTPLSDRIFFDTFDDCQKNLVLINLVQR